jgi:hypothetical protein
MVAETARPVRSHCQGSQGTSLAIWFGALTIALSFIISAVASKCGVDVDARFLERRTVIPSMQVADGPEVRLTAASLSTWLTNQETAAHAREYVFWVLPFDFIFMFLFGAFMALGSLHFAEAIALPGSLDIWLWLLPWLLPVAYVVCDAMEDVSIIRILVFGTNKVDSKAFDNMRWWTRYKLRCATLALTQIIGLGIWAWYNSQA